MDKESKKGWKHMKRKYIVISGVLVCTLVLGNISMSAMSAQAATSASEKEEVVYIMTDSNGDTESVNVVNIFGKGDITDYGDYSSVKMLSSTSPIKQNGDEITFTSDQDKIYYQGTLEDAQIPWNISIKYLLDGKEITPEKLAGQDGHLEIQIKIDKNEACTSDFYDSYALQASLTLDTEKCENITADGATMANVGSNKQISYTILPGKGLDAAIEADVTDFEMDAAAINGIRLNLDVSIDDEELMDKVREIMDAAVSLNDGASELNSGTAELKDGSSSLKSGVTSLSSGTTSLDQGIGSLQNGMTQVQNGLDTLNSQSGSLTSGSAQMLQALKTVQSSLSQVSASTEQLQQLTDSSSAIKKAISDLYDGAAALQNSLSYSSYEVAMKANGLDVSALAQTNSQTISSLETQISQLQQSIEQVKSAPGYSESQELQASVQQMETQVESLKQIIQLLKGNNGAIAGTKEYLNQASTGAAQLIAGLKELQTNYETFDMAIQSLADQLTGLLGNMVTLKAGITQLVDSYEKLDQGIGAYTSGVASVVAGYSQLTDGTKTLASGSKELVQGASALKDGTVDLYDGVCTLSDGTSELKDGTEEFYDKTSDMDTQVEDQIDDMIDSLSGGADETVSFVSEKNTDVDSVQFVIKTAAVEKTETVETVSTDTQQLNFWQKLIQLFHKKN